jgi:hypothetical protein
MQAERPCLNIATGQWSGTPHLGYGGEQMKVLQLGSIIVAITITAAFPIGKNPSAEPNAAAEAEANQEMPESLASSVETNLSSGNDSSALSDPSPETPKPKENYPADTMREPSDLSYLSFYPYDEFPPARKPADVVLASLSSVPIGSPLEEIKRASDAFGLDFGFMRTVAKIESDFNPKQRTGSYIGLFQLSKGELPNMDLEKSLVLAIMQSWRPTSS